MEDLDSEILKKAIKGDDKAFRALYDHYAPFVWRLVLRMTGDQQLATELLQDTFIRVHGALKKFKGDSSFLPDLPNRPQSVLMSYRKKPNFMIL